MIECSICKREFDIESEGGQEGDLGIIPVAFCPYCWAGLVEGVGHYLTDKAEVD